MADPVPELAITPCVHIELGGPGPASMKLAPRSELILEFMDWCNTERILPIPGTSGGHAGHHVGVFDAADYPRIRQWLVGHGFDPSAPRDQMPDPPGTVWWSFPPCPVCDAPVGDVKVLTEPGRRVPIGPESFIQENDRVVGHQLRPCGHKIKGWQWEHVDGTVTVTYGEIMDDR